MDRKTGEFENGRWRAGAQGLYAEYGNRVLLKHLLLNAGTFYWVVELGVWLAGPENWLAMRPGGR